MNPLACALTVSLALSFGGAHAVGQRPFQTIIQDDALMLHRPPAEVHRTVQQMSALGVDRVRLTAGWSAIAPKPDSRRRPPFEARDPADYPKGAWTALDRAVREVTGAGMQPMIDVAFFAPRWAVKRRSPGNRRNRWRPSVREFGQFALAVARRYSGHYRDHGSVLPAVRLWTTWNEPNHPTFLLPQWERTRRGWRPASPHLYRRMHRAAYSAIKSVSAANYVLLGGLASKGSRARGPTEGVPPLRFIREMACVDARLRPLRRKECRHYRPLRADGFAIHPYTYDGAPDAPDDQADSLELADLGRLTDLLAALEQRGRIVGRLPVWVTEYGYETNPPDPRGVSPERQAQYLGEATYLAWRRPQVVSFAQFLLQDIGPDPSKPVGSAARWDDYQTGLIDYKGRPKPAVTNFKVPFYARSAVDGRVRGVFVFGQVRPGSRGRQVQIQAQDRAGKWHSALSTPVGAESSGCMSFSTDSYGFFVRFVPLGGPANYRAMWTVSGGRNLPSAPIWAGTEPPQPVGELMRPSG